MDDLIRYSNIREKLPREFLLLQGTGCRWQKCTYCDYHLDTGTDPYEINQAVLAKVTGEHGILDVINSGSCFELDQKTIAELKTVVRQKKIHTLWFEAHWMYHGRLDEFAGQFPGVKVKFRTGIETFDAVMRKKWKKGIPDDVSPHDVAAFFQGICLLIGVKGQSRGMMERDIGYACELFEYFSVNAFVENTTGEKRDDGLVAWFEENFLTQLKENPKAEILIQNTDLGVG